MNIGIIIGIIIIVFMLTLAFLPGYQRYRSQYIEKVGYWDILIQFLIIAGINLYSYLQYGLGALFILIAPIPLDIIFAISMIGSYIKIRNYKKTKQI